MGIMAVAACCNENINIIYEKKCLNYYPLDAGEYTNS